MKVSFLSTICALALLLSCGDKSRKTKEDLPVQETPRNTDDNLKLVPGSDAFSKFECVSKGQPLQQIKNETLHAVAPIPSCPNVRLRQIGNSFATSIVKMDVDKEHNLYLLLETTDAKDTQQFFGKFSFIKLDPFGKPIFEVKSEDKNVFESFALHPSGEVTIVETRKVDDKDEFYSHHIWFRRLGSSGELKLEVPLKDPTIKKTDHGSPRVPFYAGATIVANGEEAYLASEAGPRKIYSLAADYRVKWSHQYLPAPRFVIVSRGNSKIFLDKEGRLILGQTVHEQDILELEILFGESYPNKDGILVYRFSSDGKKIEHKVMTNSSSMDIAGIHADGDIITFGGDIRIKKFDEPNHSYERDVIFFKFDMSTGAAITNKIIDLQRDDSAFDFVVDHQGNGIFVGRNNFVQVDSHSVVEFGQAYILKVSPTGETKNYTSFHGPRNTGLGAASLQDDDKTLFFSGIFDGPITHTGDQNPALRYQKAMIGRLNF